MTLSRCQIAARSAPIDHALACALGGPRLYRMRGAAIDGEREAWAT